jgi:hypothetical protein
VRPGNSCGRHRRFSRLLYRSLYLTALWAWTDIGLRCRARANFAACSEHGNFRGHFRAVGPVGLEPTTRGLKVARPALASESVRRNPCPNGCLCWLNWLIFVVH